MISQVKKLISQRSFIRALWHRSKAFAAATLYGFPARGLTIIGITGTDGKTTTVGMVAHILQTSGIPTAALSTAFFRMKEIIEWNATQKTSPSPFIIQKFLKRAKSEGCTHVVLECSSHGLFQGRVSYTWPTIAGFTNVTPEHLDYHGTMDIYKKDKGRLFEMLKGKGTKVLNADSDASLLYEKIPSSKTISYSVHKQIKNSDSLSALNTSSTPEQTKADIIYNHGGTEEKAALTLSLPGSFNLENALCACGCAVSAGVPFKKALSALEHFHSVPGRMEQIQAGQNFSVFVDFTVTPAAYEKTLTSLRSSLAPGKKLLVLTGSCGDRMKEKRPVVGKICSKLADIVVVTNEDPYTEDPQKIIDEVWAGVDQTQCEAHQIFDRGEAISFIFEKANEGDIVILCAKGSDTTMWVKDGQIPWNEREIAKEKLQQLKK